MSQPTLLFLLGVTQRCGTNFLYDLLKRHPDIGIHPPISEDHILERIEPLVRFANGLIGLWQDWWNFDDAEARRFVECLGDAIESFMAQGSSARYVLVKTPSPANAHLAPSVFPRSPLIFLVRDGRSVCESARLSFGKSIEEMTRIWAGNGRLILDFLHVYQGAAVPHLLVRYEDLVTDTEKQLRRLFGGLGLEASRYDFPAAASLPVRGSSVVRGGASKVHWSPLAKPPDFNPLERHRQWDRAALKAFEAVAGDVLEAFGYPTESSSPT